MGRLTNKTSHTHKGIKNLKKKKKKKNLHPDTQNPGLKTLLFHPNTQTIPLIKQKYQQNSTVLNHRTQHKSHFKIPLTKSAAKNGS
jgi:hypothetical protein